MAPVLYWYVHQIIDFHIYLIDEKAFTIPAIKGYSVALNIISALGAEVVRESGYLTFFINFERPALQGR